MRGGFSLGDGLAALALAFASAGMPSVASAAETTVRFTHPNPSEVVEFRVHVGSAPGVYDSVVSVGIPPVLTNVFHATVDVPAGVDVYIVVTAVNADGMSSVPSNEGVRRVEDSSVLTAPGTPMVVY